MADMVKPREAEFASTNLITRALGMLLRRDDCNPQPGVNLCEKPSISSNATTWIIVGVALGALVIGTLAILLFLHLRRKKRDAREDREDRYQNSDYGLDELPTTTHGSRGAAKKPRRAPMTDDDAKWSSTDGDGGSPHGYDRRRSRDPLQAGQEPKYQPGVGAGVGVGGQADGYLNPFDDVSGRGGQSPRVGEGR